MQKKKESTNSTIPWEEIKGVLRDFVKETGAGKCEVYFNRNLSSDTIDKIKDLMLRENI